MTKIFLAVALAAFALFLPIPSHARHPKEQPHLVLNSDKKLAPEDRQHLLNDTFTIVKTVHEIPAPVHDLLFQHVTSYLYGMADAGKDWQEGDVLASKPLPFRRLILAANSAQYSLVYDEHGGFVYYTLISLYRLDGGSAKLVWSGGVGDSPGLLSFDQIRALFRSENYHLPKSK